MLICAEIEHSQGASEFALLGFLTLVVVAARTLPLHTLRVQLPVAQGRPMSQLFTQGSLEDLARIHGFKWSGLESSADRCSRREYDVRVGVVTAVSSSLSIPHDAPAPNLTALVPASSPAAHPIFYGHHVAIQYEEPDQRLVHCRGA